MFLENGTKTNNDEEIKRKKKTKKKKKEEERFSQDAGIDWKEWDTRRLRESTNKRYREKWKRKRQQWW